MRFIPSAWPERKDLVCYRFPVRKKLGVHPTPMMLSMCCHRQDLRDNYAMRGGSRLACQDPASSEASCDAVRTWWALQPGDHLASACG